MRIVPALPPLCVAAMVALGPDVGVRALEGEIAVGVENRSEPVRCAEEDNVYLPFHSPRVHSFRIEVAHPAYVGTIAADRSAPDWTSCSKETVPSVTPQPYLVTIQVSNELWFFCRTYSAGWPPATVPFKTGNQEEKCHILQMWLLKRGQLTNHLVAYPDKGYWRGRPLPPDHLKATAYGTSFLIGPVEETEKLPKVALKGITFEPTTNTFRLSFVRGGAATLKLDDVDQERMILDVAFDDHIPTGKPFAALRSMYVTEFNSDAARVAWLTRDGKGWNEAPIMAFAGASAVAFWLGRTAPSRHNLSAPDIVFSDFRDGTLAHGSVANPSSSHGPTEP